MRPFAHLQGSQNWWTNTWWPILRGSCGEGWNKIHAFGMNRKSTSTAAGAALWSATNTAQGCANVTSKKNTCQWDDTLFIKLQWNTSLPSTTATVSFSSPFLLPSVCKHLHLHLGSLTVSTLFYYYLSITSTLLLLLHLKLKNWKIKNMQGSSESESENCKKRILDQFCQSTW